MGWKKTLRSQVLEANLELVKQKLVIYSFGNVSGIDRKQNIVAIKPSGVPYESLTEESIVLVDMDGNVVEGDFRPSSDTRTHLELYRSFPGIGGVAHTHSPYATSWAQACESIPCYGTTHADYVNGEIPCTGLLSDEQINGDYEHVTGVKIRETLANRSVLDVPMILVASHGPFTWGPSARKAVENSVILEYLARTAAQTRRINPDFQPIQPTLLARHFNRKHGTSATYGQKREKGKEG